MGQRETKGVRRRGRPKGVETRDAVLERQLQTHQALAEHFDHLAYVARVTGSRLGERLDLTPDERELADGLIAPWLVDEVTKDRACRGQTLVMVKRCARVVAEGCARAGESWSDLIACYAEWIADPLAQRRDEEPGDVERLEEAA